MIDQSEKNLPLLVPPMSTWIDKQV